MQSRDNQQTSAGAFNPSGRQSMMRQRRTTVTHADVKLDEDILKEETYS